jgi:hypothetical protein
MHVGITVLNCEADAHPVDLEAGFTGNNCQLNTRCVTWTPQLGDSTTSLSRYTSSYA